MIHHFRLAALVSTAGLLFVSASSQAQQPPPQFPNMTFFITSVGGPSGANFGGLDGADKHCQTLAEKAGAGGKTWRAYLSTQALGGATAVNAKDRIGKGPWVNAKGVQIAASVADLHSANNKIAPVAEPVRRGVLNESMACFPGFSFRVEWKWKERPRPGGRAGWCTAPRQRENGSGQPGLARRHSLLGSHQL